jgi:hypothetical protein
MTALDIQGSLSPHPHVTRQDPRARRLASGTVVCAACGCRLTTRDTIPGGDGSWWHFAGRSGRDARGCTVDCVEAAHRLA